MMRTTAFLVLSFVALGCQRTHYAEEIRTLDSLRADLDSASNQFRLIDTTGFSNAGRVFTENLAYVQQKYTQSEDTIPREVAMLMADYRDLKKPSKGFISDYERTREELKFSKSQIRDLKHDLQNNLLDTNIVVEMLNDEIKAVEDVVSKVNQLKVSSEYTKQKRAELEPRIDSLIKELKKQPS